MGMKAAALLKVRYYLNKVGHLQEGNPFIFNLILLVKANNLTLRF